MRLFLVGANGATGRHVVAQALAAGHTVTAFVRHSAQLTERAGLSIIEGQVADDADGVRTALKGHDAVISTLGNPLWLRGLRGPAIMERSFRNLVAGMEANGIARIAAPLAWGTGASRDAAGLLVQIIAATIIKRDYRDFDAAEAVLTQSKLGYCIAYFGALTDDPATRDWSASSHLEKPGRLRIARADVATFLLRAIQDHSLARGHVVLSGGREAMA